MEVWKCQALLQGNPGYIQAGYIDERMRELEESGTSIDELAMNDPVGLLWHLGVLCTPRSTHVDLRFSNLKLLHKESQQTFSAQILEEHFAVEQPMQAATALLAWIRGKNSDGSWGNGNVSFDIDGVLKSALAEKARAASPSVSASTGSPGSETRVDSDQRAV